jgi:cytidylate kinase
MQKKLIIACDGGAASGKSTGAKLIANKYKLLLLNSGLYYRYASFLILKNRPKDIIKFLQNKLNKVSYKHISVLDIHSQEISKYVPILAQNRGVRKIIDNIQKKIIKNNNRICIEGRDIASKILNKNPKYDIAFYFTCNLKVASLRRWHDLKKKVPLNEVKRTLRLRTKLDKNRIHSPLIRVKDSIIIQSDKMNKIQMLGKMIASINKKNFR